AELPRDGNRAEQQPALDEAAVVRLLRRARRSHERRCRVRVGRLRGGGRAADERCGERQRENEVESAHGAFKTQRCRSLSGLKRSSVGVLLPMAVSASGSSVPGTAFGIRRYVPSVSWSMRQSCSGALVNAGTTASSRSAVAASARCVPAIVIL